MTNDPWLDKQLTSVKDLLKQAAEKVKENKFAEAEAPLKEAELILDSVDGPHEEALRLRAMIYNNMGALAVQSNAPDKALAFQHKLLESFEGLAALGGANPYLLERVNTLIQIGLLSAGARKPQDGVTASRKALELMQSFPVVTPQAQIQAHTLDMLANYHLGLNLHIMGDQKAEATLTLQKAAERALAMMKAGQAVPHVVVELLGNAARVHADQKLYDRSYTYARRGADVALALFEKSKQQLFLQQYVNLEMDLVTYAERTQQFSKGEDSLFKVLDVLPGDPNVIKRGEAYYESLLKLDDATLTKGGLPRDEVESSLKDVRARKKPAMA